MSQALDSKGLDELFFRIFSGLLQNIIIKSDDAAEKILELSSEVVGKDIQSALEAFHNLYQDDSIDKAQNEYNQQVDDIIDAHQQGQVSDAIVDALDDSQSHSLADLQQQLERAINADEAIKAKAAPILHAIQFSELMHRHITNIEYAWQETIQRIDKDDSQTIANDIGQSLSTLAERQAFNTYVLKGNPKDISNEDDIDNLLNSIL
ncbi:MAG: hypothetical protein HOM11_04090 [Methylococcales bacterium]|jgi:hypothetical protein|nr:hypothetical protein [Methylococcales bacterium]MBT7443578.1 hypothetical protein [Methylococcales bacterium]